MKKVLSAIFIISGAFAFSSCQKNGVSPVTTTPPVVKVAVVDSLKLNLLAWYTFNSSGADSSGKGNDVYGYYDITSAANRFNKSNSAFYFDGSSSYIQVKDNSSLRLSGTDFTINVWLYLPAIGARMQILVKRSPTPAGYALGITPDGTTFFGPGGGAASAAGTIALTAAAWHMVTVTYKSTSPAAGTVTLYIDGVVSGTPVPDFPTPDASVSDDLYIGHDQSVGYFLNGSIDDLRIYNKWLSQKDITALMKDQD